MKKATILALLGACASIMWHCGQNTPGNSSSPLTVKMEHFEFKKCLKDSLCASMNFTFPVLEGGPNPVATKTINDSIASFVAMLAYDGRKLPVKTALDSASILLYDMMAMQYKELPDYTIGYTAELKSTVLLKNAKYFSISLDNYSFAGGAHGNYGTALNTFDLNTGKYIELTEIIADTSAIRPMLEKAFVAQKKQDSGEDLKLEDLLFPDFKQLPMPLQWCVVQDGVRFIYNPYEVAAYAIGQTDILLRWEELGNLADRKKWLE